MIVIPGIALNVYDNHAFVAYIEQHEARLVRQLTFEEYTQICEQFVDDADEIWSIISC
jgi:hypothetical protein